MTSPATSDDSYTAEPAREVRVGSYRVGSVEPLGEEAVRQLVDTIGKGPSGAEPPGKGASATAVLRGRAPVFTIDLAGVGPVVVKAYARGGVLRHLNTRRYLRWGKSRAEREFETLRAVRALGVNAPEPVAFASHGRIWYQAWLVTRRIAHRTSLAELGRSDEDAARDLTFKLVDQLSVLIRHGIFHIDLHPGNVLVGEDDSLHLLDFDKARSFFGSKNKLRDLYLRRWRRAVIKHGLPEALTEVMCMRLRTNYETAPGYDKEAGSQ